MDVPLSNSPRDNENPKLNHCRGHPSQPLPPLAQDPGGNSDLQQLHGGLRAAWPLAASPLAAGRNGGGGGGSRRGAAWTVSPTRAPGYRLKTGKPWWGNHSNHVVQSPTDAFHRFVCPLTSLNQRMFQEKYLVADSIVRCPGDQFQQHHQRLRLRCCLEHCAGAGAGGRGGCLQLLGWQLGRPVSKSKVCHLMPKIGCGVVVDHL